MAKNVVVIGTQWGDEGKGKIVDLLKTELDGIKKNKGVVTILTTNFPEKLPDALLDRPGRFSDVLNFDLPDESVRIKMIQKWLGIEEVPKEILAATAGFSGAHMWEFIEYAKSIAEEEGISVSDALTVSLNKIKKQRELIRQIRGEVLPEIDPEEKELDVNILQEQLTEVIEKAGRRISGQSQSLIQQAIEILNQLISGQNIDNAS